MRWRAYIVLIIGCLTLCIIGHEWGKDIVNVDINPQVCICSNFIGFGAEWDSTHYTGQNVTDDDFKIISQRVSWMRLPVARIMMLAKWCYLGKDRFDFETREMQDLYRHLDVCEDIGTTVFLTDWGIQREGLVAHNLRNVVDPLYAQVIAVYLEHLIFKKKYTCIKYFTFGNEPNWEVQNFQQWKKGYLNVHRELKQSGLLKHINLVGPEAGISPGKRESSIAQEWFYPGVKELSQIAMAYGIHRYESKISVRDGHFQQILAKYRRYAIENDPMGDKKPFIIGEAGMKDGSKPPAINSNTSTFEYGVFMADYAIQAVNAGASAVSAWMLDDNSHKKFTWGMWSNKANGLNLKPWFYTWSLLCRYLPSGSHIVRTKVTNPAIRVLAAQAFYKPSQKKCAWTFCIVNRSDELQTIRLNLKNVDPVCMYRYVYSRNATKTNDCGFPEVVDRQIYNLASGASILCEAESFTVLTTITQL